MTKEYLKAWRAKRRGKLCVECTNPVAAGRLTLCEAHSVARERDAKKFRRTSPANVLWTKAKYRAKKLRLAFDISVEDVVIPKVCPILGIKLSIRDKVHHAGSPSLDRIVPLMGYVKGNVQVISKRANQIKSDASLEELETIGRWAKRQRRQ